MLRQSYHTKNFYNLNLENQDFSNTDLFFCNFARSNLRNTSFEGSKIIGGILQDVDLSFSNLKNFNLGDNIAGAIFTGADLRGATFPGVLSRSPCHDPHNDARSNFYTPNYNYSINLTDTLIDKTTHIPFSLFCELEIWQQKDIDRQLSTAICIEKLFLIKNISFTHIEELIKLISLNLTQIGLDHSSLYYLRQLDGIVTYVTHDFWKTKYLIGLPNEIKEMQKICIDADYSDKLSPCEAWKKIIAIAQPIQPSFFSPKRDDTVAELCQCILNNKLDNFIAKYKTEIEKAFYNRDEKCSRSIFKL